MHLKTKRARLLALSAFVAVLGMAAFSASPAGSISSLLFGRTTGTPTKIITQTTASFSPDSRTLPATRVASDTTLGVARKGHTATLLSDGRVLVVGGENQNGFVAEAEIFDPATGSFSFTGNLNMPRSDHTATRLSDGRVLISSGRGDPGPLNSTEIFDPGSGAFNRGPELNSPRSGQSATALSDGRIVLAGGDAAGSVEIYDPATNEFSSLAVRMSAPRAQHGAALLNDGRILFAGGTATDDSQVLSGEILNIATPTFEIVGNLLTDEHIRPTMRVLPDGKVQIIGGSDHEVMEVYDPSINAFGAHAHVYPIGDSHPALLQEILGSPTRAALFRLGASDPLLNREGQAITELSVSNQALVLGGIDSNGAFLDSASALSSSTATVTTDKIDYAPGMKVIVTGTGWQPGEVVTLMFHEDPHVESENPHTFVVQADANGNFVSQEYAPEELDHGTAYILAATGGSSGYTAQTSFHDAVTYFSQGSLAPNLTTSWNTLPGGGGTQPANFTSGDTFVIQNGHNMTTSATWSVSGSGSQLMISNGGTLTATSAVTLAAGTAFQILAGGTYVHNNTTAFGSTIFQGTELFDPASTVILNNSNSTGPSGVAFGNLTINFTSDPGSNVNSGGGLTTIAGNFTVTSTSVRQFVLSANTSYTLTIGGNLVVQGGLLDLTNGSLAGRTYTINLAGNYSQSGGTFQSSNANSPSKIVFTGGSASTSFTQSGGLLTNTNINWQIASGKTVQFNNGFVIFAARSVTVDSGGVFVSAATFNNGGTFTVNGELRLINGGAANGNSYTYGAGATLDYSGSSARTSTNTEFPSSNGPANLTIDNAGGVTLHASRTINGTLALTNGLVTTGANTLTVGSSGSISGGSATSNVDGILARVYSATGSKDFPIGKGGNFRPLTVNYTALTGTSTVSAEQFESGFAGTPPAGTAQLGTRYWHVTESGGSSFTYNLTLDGTGTSPTGAVKIVKYDSPNTVAFATTTPNYTATGLTSFSDFTLAEVTCVPPSITAQPVEQTVCQESTVQFSVTATGTSLTYQWRKNGVNIGDGATGNGSIYSGTTTNTLTITNAAVADSAPAQNGFDVIVSGDCTPSETSTRVALTVDQNPNIATAGPDQDLCETSTATLAGNPPSVGSGTWTLVGGAGSITTPSSPTSSVTGLGYGANVFRWTISNGTCTPSEDTVTITRYQSPTVASAGADQTVCGTTATLAGNSPAVGMGTWTLVSGSGSISSPNSPTSGVTGLGFGANTFRWTINNGVCADSTDDVVIATDLVEPMISCPADIDTYAYSNAGATANYTTPVGTDNCSATTAQTAGLASGSTFPVGTTTNTFEVTDGAGLKATCSFDVTVNQAPTTTTVTSSSNPSVYGDNVSFTATVAASAGGGAPTGTVQFKINGSPYGGPVTLVGGMATAPNTGPLTAGGHSVTANYSGDVGFETSTGSLTQNVNKRNATWTTNPNSKYYGQADPEPITTGSGSNFVSSDGVSATYSRDPGSSAGPYYITATLSSAAPNALDNYNITNPGNTFTINPDPTLITLDARTSGMNFDCIDNQYAATLTDTITGGGLSGVVLKLTIGSESTTATTDAFGVATFTLTLDQPVGNVTESVGLNSPWTDPNRVAPSTVSRSFTILANPNVQPGRDATSLSTGSLFFWTTSPTSSTATLTLSATLLNIGSCNGDITRATVSFYISSNGGSSFSPVQSAQNLPVGRVDPNDPNLGAASAISQYNIGNSQSVTLIVRVVVGGEYTSNNTAQYDLPITIGKPGQANSLMGAAELQNDGLPYPATGYLGINAINSYLSSQIVYNKKGINPQGQLTVKITSCNRIDGTLEPGCDAGTPAKHHTYWIKSNSISELSLISGSASFGAKTNGYEMLPDGSKINFDSGNSMQIVFTPYLRPFIPGTYAAGYGSNDTCTHPNGCASAVLFRSAGGIWFSSSWGLPGNPASTTPRSLIKNVASGLLVVN